MTRILLVGGGSIGHVAPAVAVWRALQRMKPDAVLQLVCSEEPGDAAFLEKEGIAFIAIRGRRLSLARPDIFGKSFVAAWRLVKSFKPDVVFSKGGALSVPLCLAARVAGVPIVLHESDAVNGRANRLVSRWAVTVCDGFPGGGTQSAHVFTGNPVRPAVAQGSRTEGLRITGLSGTRPVLLVMGGSQGAQALNAAIVRHLDVLLQSVEILHLTGKGKPGAPARAGYWSAEFAYETLPHLYAAADLALSRAGAGGISELAACGVPALLVPLRGLAQDHQFANARAAELAGACVLLHQEELDATLLPAVQALATHERRRAALAAGIRGLSSPDSAERIARIVLDATGSLRV